MDNLIIEVKSSKGKEFTEQLDRILSAAGDKPVVVYGPKLKKHIKMNVKARNVKIFTNQKDLIDYIRTLD